MLCPRCGALPTESQSEEAPDLHVASVTRHHTLFNCNEPPEDSEKTFIQSVISTADARVAHLDEEIAKLRIQLKHLEGDRASVIRYRERNSAILSPLRRMPPEILSEMFLWTLPPIDDVLCEPKLDTAASPWVLSHVSGCWRAIALCTPSLWSRIAVDFSKSEDASSAYPLPFVEAQLERARNLKIHFYGDSGAESQPQFQLFQLLAQHSSRWEELSVGITAAIVPLLPALRDRLPLLKRLWIQWHSADTQTVESMDCFQMAPSLVDAGVFNQHRSLPTIFPVRQLTRYQLDGPWATHREILKLAANLIEARIEIDFDDDPWPETAEIINLRHVQRLYSSHVEVLLFLRVPLLEALAIWVPPHDTNPLPAAIQSFVYRSACPLRRLSLRGYPDADVTCKILHGCSSITELIIVAANSDAEEDVDTLMTTLTVRNLPDNTVISPQLRFIVFGSENDGHPDDTLFLRMVKSRWDADDCALKSATLVVDSGPEPDPTIVDSFRALRQEGLNLSFLLDGYDGVDELKLLSYGTSWN
ncbi:hypothetical protein C8R47DRAFT_50137 [Mycena vitilis]|nr:hypothetical protein C8R47DRAFT_50137 [Mycena vitilis]